MRKAFFQALILFILLVLPFGLLLHRRAGNGGSAAEKAADERSSPQNENVVAPAPPEHVSGPGARASADVEEQQFVAWEAFLAEAGSRGSSRNRLEQWRAQLDALPPEEAVDRLLDYLASGRDLDLELPFQPGPEGELQSAPTLRTAALDLIGRLAPEQAHALAARALEGPKTSADEFAIHLRNFAWGAPESMNPARVREYLADRTLELIRHPAWQSEPTGGYQEAFDVLVWSRATGTVSELAALMRDATSTELTHPAGLTLDRLVIAAPRETLSALVSEAETGFPLAEAGFFARADAGDPAQRDALETWFLNPARTADQRDYLLRLIPNFNLRLSNNLLSQNQTYSQQEIRQRLTATQALLDQWSHSPDFAPWQNEIASATARLNAILRDAETN